MKFKIIFAISLICFLATCSSNQTEEQPVEKTQKEFPEFFQKILEAHGGWEAWEKMNTLKFTSIRSNPNTEYTVDLKSRMELIEVDGKYQLGNDGDKVWVAPVRDSFPGKSPRFMKNLVFYFVAVPFVFADDGVNLEMVGTQKIDGLEYQVIEATFGDGVGDAPEDIYKMYVNPNTSIVQFITYSVTYFNKENATKFNALKYDWKNVNGLLFPEKYTGYIWHDSTFGDERYQSPFDNASYSEAKADNAIFKIPEGAHVE